MGRSKKEAVMVERKIFPAPVRRRVMVMNYKANVSACIGRCTMNSTLSYDDNVPCSHLFDVG